MSSVARASILNGTGTIASRLSGFLRSVVLVSAIGSMTGAGNAFALANQLPNNIYAIISAGLLSAVLVPQIVKAGSHADGGHAFISKIVTLGTVILFGVTVAAVAAAPLLVQLYGGKFTPEEHALATTFAYWCLPQILFYGLFAMIGEILNARGIYGPYMWAPIINNVVSIAGFGTFIALFGMYGATTGWTTGMIALLAGVATAGIVLQAATLLLFWRRTRIRLRADFRWRGVGLRGIGQLAGWTFLMLIAGQLAGLVQSNVLSGAGVGNAGIFATQNAWLVFMLPYSIIVMSIGTPYFTRLSEHAAARRFGDVKTDIGRAIRTLGLLIVGATVALAVAAVPASRVFTNSQAEAVSAGQVLLCFLVSLIPLAVLFVIQRTFYALDDTRTPFFFMLLQAILSVAGALLSQALLPPELLAAGIALSQSLAGVIQVIVAAFLLHRRLGGIGTASWVRPLGRFALAAVPAAGAGWLVYLLLGGVDGWMTSDKLLGAAGAAIIGSATMAAYFLVLAVFRDPELTPALRMFRRLLRRRSPQE